MRLGMNHTLPHASPEEWAKTLRELHCGAAIFPVAGDAPEELIAAYCAAAEKYDIVIAEVGIWANPISPIASVREQAVARSLSQLLCQLCRRQRPYQPRSLSGKLSSGNPPGDCGTHPISAGYRQT